MKVIVLQLETKREEELLEKVLKVLKEKSKNRKKEKNIQDILDFLSDEESFDEIYSKSNQSRLVKVTSLLNEIGIPSNIQGFRYIRKGVISILDNVDNLYIGITKKIYEELSQEYNVSIASIERGIRYAIECAWKRGNQNLIKSICGCSVNETRPGNTEFLLSVVDLIKLNETE